MAITQPLDVLPSPLATGRPIGASPESAPAPLPWRDTFASLRLVNFRIFTAAHLVAVVAIWMQRIAQDWMVLQLSGSVAAVGITTALQFLPTLLLGPFGGMVADRFSKRAILMLSQSLAGALALTLAVLTLTGAVAVWQVNLIALGLGLVTVIDQPARQVFVNEMVGPRLLRNAISVNSSVFQLGALVGPVIAGVLIVAVGGGWAFAINSAACCFTVLMLGALRTGQLVRSLPAPRSRGMLREGLRYALGRPTIFWPAVTCAFISVFALSMPVLMVAFADHVFHTGAGGFGLLSTLVAVGALTGAVASTRRRVLRLRTVVFAAGGFGTVLASAAFAPSLPIFGAVMVLAGFCSMQFVTAANQLVQASAEMHIRGRVMSLYIMVLIGGQSIGGPLIGWLAEHLGPHQAIFTAGAVPAAASVVIGLLLARRGQLRLTVRLRRRPRIRITVRSARELAVLKRRRPRKSRGHRRTASVRA